MSAHWRRQAGARGRAFAWVRSPARFSRGENVAPAETGAALFVRRAPLPQAASARETIKERRREEFLGPPLNDVSIAKHRPPPPSRRVGRSSDRSAEDFVRNPFAAAVSQNCRNPTGFRTSDCNSSQLFGPIVPWPDSRALELSSRVGLEPRRGERTERDLRSYPRYSR